ncbi:DUF429 domain-containing protein [Variovorax sp.]|uniref:DUF429 domain-containing protein n=1 Tax=Variovorax sp. TaxID=1871043 RepID=UPI002D6F804E|nr:DUF429 domain-containing protein [Variovorax sp.]HYP84898.1 DUF429 domain-containing protein [Variovorax sp.]
MPALLVGCDFSSAPTRRKNIVVATGGVVGADVRLQAVHRFHSLDAWSDWLGSQPAWVGAFDLPFGLPRELIESLQWPLDWRASIAHFAGIDRVELRRRLAAFCAARPAGGKFAHRATDGPAGSSPSMKWVNPPVAWMLHAGVPRLLATGAHFPAHLPPPQGEPARVALEGYPGLVARDVLGRTSYKSDAATRQDEGRREARECLLRALEAGQTRLGLSLAVGGAHRAELVADGSADTLDAVLCLMQAAWAARRADSPGRGYGVPPGVDPLEGWIVGATPP